MSECYGCGKVHPGEPCANTVSDLLIPVIGLVPLPIFLIVLAIAKIGEVIR